MRILFLVYARQNSFTSFAENPKTKFSWVDALIEELVNSQDTRIGLAVPINDQKFQKNDNSEICLYGLPNPVGKSILKKSLRRLTNDSGDNRINSYVFNVVEDFKPDIIQIFGSENPFGLIIKKLKVPVVIHIQGYLLVWQVKWFTGITKWQQLRYESLKNLLLRRGSFNEYSSFTKRAEREEIILKDCRYFVGRTDFDRRLVPLFSPESAYFHCEEFIRKEFFDMQWNLPLSKEITCISILKGTSYKGIDLLVETLMVLKKYSSLSFRFKICGVSADEGIVKIIKKKYKKHFRLLNIEFLGRLTADALIEQLCNSNFYVHPSYIENSPNSVCEAMALGMPVISTHVGGLNNIIHDGVEGILVQEGEPYSLSGAIIDLANNYDKAKLLGLNARKKSVYRHQPQRIKNELLDIYKAIITDYERN